MPERDERLRSRGIDLGFECGADLLPRQQVLTAEEVEDRSEESTSRIEKMSARENAALDEP